MVASLTLVFEAAIVAVFCALCLWQARRSLALPQQVWLSSAFGLTAIWAITSMVSGFDAPAALVAEAPRNIAWLGFVISLSGEGGRQEPTRAINIVYFLVTLIIIVNWLTAILRFGELIEPHNMVTISTSQLLAMTGAVGAMVLTHNRYMSVDPGERSALILPLSTFGVLWLTELNYYGFAYLAMGMSEEMNLVRVIIMLSLAPAFAIAMMRNPDWRFSVSRRAAFQSASVIVIGGYILAIALVSWSMSAIGGHAARVAQVGFVMGTATIGLVLLPSARFRAWLKVKVAKHFYAHRYDYREEWLGFTNTIGQHQGDGQPFDVRIIRAMADFVDSPGGALLVPGGEDGLLEKAVWNWNGTAIPQLAADLNFVRFLEKTGHIVDFRSPEKMTYPIWMTQQPDLWVAIPLLHNANLVGVVLLEKPLIDRPLDWEDLDLFRLAGRQAASYLAEEASQLALADARQFEEFNRRFAFMMHDIKNVVSQLSLVSRNAEKHADNPEFRVDMVATLKNATDKMNVMLQRLSQHGQMTGEPVRPIMILDLVGSVVQGFKGRHPIVVMRDTDVAALADPHRLEQAITHLVQNAVDASAPSEPVTIAVRENNNQVMIDVIDRGSGMSPQFVANQLFKPFSSSKINGFGIGAYEARELVQAMGGELTVQSVANIGTHFTIILQSALSSTVGERRA